MVEIDLHCHSEASLDGEFEPVALVKKAILSGIKYFAITDHDVVDSLQAAIDYANKTTITFIPGIELSVDMDGTPLHILCYNADFKDKRYKERAKSFKRKVRVFGKKLIQKAYNYGFQFDEQLPYTYRKDHLVCEEIIGSCILNDPRNDNDSRLKEFRPGGVLSDNPNFNFYKCFCAPGRPLYTPYSTNISMENAAKMIHETGGKMFLAHPGYNIGHSLELFNKVLSYGLDGIEVFSTYHHRDDTDFFYEMAKKNNLLMSVGSDFHGKNKPSIQIGSVNYDRDELKKTIKEILC